MNSLERDFFSFIYQRQLIWYKRTVLRESSPWTNDELLQTYKFINMYRELDRCTKYLLEKIKSMHDKKSLLLNIIFFRFFNRDQIYETLGVEPFFEINALLKEKIIENLSNRKKAGYAIFNDAYLIAATKDGEKHREVIENLYELSKNSEQILFSLLNSKTPEDSFKILCSLPLVGPFLACEIWTDLTYIKFFDNDWTDDDFVNIGPGAAWGLEILAGRKLSRVMQKEKLYELHEKQKEILPQIHHVLTEPLSWETISYASAYSNCPFLSLTNIEGALCEFRKYYNLKNGRGKRRYFIQKRD